MSYEICVLDPLLGDTREAAYQAWNDCSYFDDSKVDMDRSAPKWHTRQALAALNPRLTWKEPKPPATGFFASLRKKPPSEKKALIADLPVDDSSASFYVYDRAIEIDLPWALKTTP